MIADLHDTTAVQRGGCLHIESQVTFATGTLPAGSVSFSVEPGGHGVADPAPVAALPAVYVLACRLGQDLRVDHPVPPALHRGARQVGELLRRWYGWRPAELIAPLGAEPARPRRLQRQRGTGVFFTRGVDSWGTLLDLQAGPRAGRPTHLITVDNELHVDAGIRSAATIETQAVADVLGLPLIRVATDIRALIDPHTDWGTETHGSVLAGIALLLRRTLGTAVIAPTHWTPLLRPWGSHPELDPCWSVPGLRIVHHDGDEMRWKRVERIVAHPVASRSVLVCWQGTSTRNCGRCEKCLRLMTSLELLGRGGELADRFDVAFDPSRIGPGLVVSPHPWCDTMDHLDRCGLRADALRQRWEQVPRIGRPAMWFQTRPIQPRLPVDRSSLTPAEAPEAVEALARRLAPLGLRVDRLDAPAVGGPAIVLGHAPTGWTATLRYPGAKPEAVGLDALAIEPLFALVAAAGLDPAASAPFDPDGQEPPPVVPEPPDWEPAHAAPTAASHQ